MNIKLFELDGRIIKPTEHCYMISWLNDAILKAIDECKRLYETPTVRAYIGIQTMLDNMSRYLADTEITDGRDGNIRGMLAAAKEFKHIRESYKGVMTDVEEESKVQTRGKSHLPYDMRRKARRS